MYPVMCHCLFYCREYTFRLYTIEIHRKHLISIYQSVPKRHRQTALIMKSFPSIVNTNSHSLVDIHIDWIKVYFSLFPIFCYDSISALFDLKLHFISFFFIISVWNDFGPLTKIKLWKYIYFSCKKIPYFPASYMR